MTKTKKKTKDRLLEAACAVFAEKGYRDTTIAEICERADANVAAVNYHFRDKARLYNEAFKHAWAIASEIFPMGDLNDSSIPASDRLRGFITAILNRGFCETDGGWLASFMKHESTDPTEWNEAIFEEIIGPVRQKMLGLIGELLGVENEAAVHCCMYSLMSQCLHLKMNTALRKRFNCHNIDSADMVIMLVDHILSFTLAGIRDKAQRLQEGRV